jgi:hypothetical protein
MIIFNDLKLLYIKTLFVGFLVILDLALYQSPRNSLVVSRKIMHEIYIHVQLSHQLTLSTLASF